MRIAKSAVIISIVFSILSVGAFVYKTNYGYYPVPFIAKLVYYSCRYGSSYRFIQTVDKNFKISTNGHVSEYTLNNMLNVPYCVYVRFNTKNNPLPMSYQYTGKLKITITRNNSVQYLHFTDGISKVVGHDPGDKISTEGNNTDGYYVAVLPFPLKKGTLNNTKLSITVANVDNKLISYADDAQITIIPEIDLDDGVPYSMLETGIHNY